MSDQKSGRPNRAKELAANRAEYGVNTARAWTERQVEQQAVDDLIMELRNARLARDEAAKLAAVSVKNRS